MSISMFLRPPGRTLTIAAVLWWLQNGMAALAMVLWIHDVSGSFRTAGLVVAAFAVGGAVLAPWRGRSIDRYGHKRVLQILGAVFVAGLVGLMCVQLLGIWTAFVFAAIAGAASPPVVASARMLWGQTETGDRLQRAYTSLVVLGDVCLAIGPLITAALVAAGSPLLALGACVATTLGATNCIARVSGNDSVGKSNGPRARGLGVIKNRGLQLLVLVDFAVGCGAGTLDVCLPAFAAKHGDEALAGILLGAVSAGSLITGVWFGKQQRPRALRAYPWFVGLLALGFVMPIFATSMTAMVIALVITGATWTPAVLLLFNLLDRVAPDNPAEAFTWSTSALSTGIAVGAAVAGALVGHGFTLALAIPAVLIGASALVVGIGRRRLLLKPAGGVAS